MPCRFCCVLVKIHQYLLTKLIDILNTDLEAFNYRAESLSLFPIRSVNVAGRIPPFALKPLTMLQLKIGEDKGTGL